MVDGVEQLRFQRKSSLPYLELASLSTSTFCFASGVGDLSEPLASHLSKALTQHQTNKVGRRAVYPSTMKSVEDLLLVILEWSDTIAMFSPEEGRFDTSFVTFDLCWYGLSRP